ncbi:hypothetical protein EDD85DRAFT_270137 [Armillaria nabsnona]|nr:hypothetical protein EDD85DRAFT_270137 [Armillaria nabsnona]
MRFSPGGGIINLRQIFCFLLIQLCGPVLLPFQDDANDMQRQSARAPKSGVTCTEASTDFSLKVKLHCSSGRRVPGSSFRQLHSRVCRGLPPGLLDVYFVVAPSHQNIRTENLRGSEPLYWLSWRFR